MVPHPRGGLRMDLCAAGCPHPTAVRCGGGVGRWRHMGLCNRGMWRRRFWQWPTLICSVLGALLALFLIGERLVMAIGYMLR